MEEYKYITNTGLYTAIWVEFGASTLVVILRIYSQAFIVRKVAIDDVLMFAAWGFQLAASIISTLGTQWGMGMKSYLLNYEQIVHVLKYGAFAMPVGALSSMCGRIGFICFLLLSVITVYRYRRWLLWSLVVTQLVVNIVPIILEFTTCKPVSKLWNFMGEGVCEESVVVQQMGYFQGGVNGLTDLLLTLLALFVVMSLKLKRKTKITLGVLLSLSLFAMVAAVLKTVALRQMLEPDLSYAYGMWTIWNLTEGTVVIITASIPRLRPLLVLIKKKGIEFTTRNYNRKTSDSDRYGRSRDHYQHYHRHMTAHDISSEQYLPRWPEPIEFHGLVEKGNENSRAIPLASMTYAGDIRPGQEDEPVRGRRSLWSPFKPTENQSRQQQGSRKLEIWQQTQISVQVNRMDAAAGAGL
ncbi:hypothetical protein BDV12DRAFT_203893 [Aspergillus spectabilis]